MKYFRIIFLLLAMTFTSTAQVVNVKVTVTNAPVNTDTLTIGGKVFTWTNGTPIGANAILITNTFGGDATNLFNVSGLVLPFSGINLTNSASNAVTFSRIALTASSTAGWALLEITTNASSPNTNVVVPIATVDSASRTAIETQLITDIGTYSAVALDQASTAASQLVGTNNDQSIGGKKVFVGTLNGTLGNLTNGNATNLTIGNGVNVGLPFRSPGTGTGSEQFGLGASAADGSIAFGDAAVAAGGDAVALGFNAIAPGIFCTAVGALAQATNIEDSAFGKSAKALGGLSTAIGYSTQATNGNDTAIGQHALTTAPHQIMLGTSSDFVQFPGGVLFKGTETNLTTAGTNTIGGALAFTKYANTTLVNGYNSDIIIGTNSVVVFSGPGAAFTNAGFVAGVDQQIVITKYYGAQSESFISQSGVDGTAANRLNFGPAGTVLTLTTVPAIAGWQYNSALSLWELLFHN